MLGSSSINPRTKRASSSQHSSKLSVKDLALELAKKHVSLTDLLYFTQLYDKPRTDKSLLFKRRRQHVSLKGKNLATI